ncbi:DUF3502 domain-containing protein [Paenibacillus sp. GCM10027626]|uniref:DUF3502 domain-containing protein n=1 Tax=Paenibacillus sp. GCM10027626 TaxID=3273411 RepID=UPI00362F40B1
MRKSLKGIRTGAIGMLLTTLLLTGCSSGANNGNAPQPGRDDAQAGNNGETKQKQEAVKLDFYLFSGNGGEPNNLQAVMDEFSKQTADALNVKINWHWTNAADIGSTVNLKLTAGEKVDAFFTAPWVSGLPINQAVSKGLVQNLDHYFNNDQYPGLKKAFDEEYLSNNKFQNAQGEYHTYAVPFTTTFTSADTIYYRKDLAKKYGIGTNGTLANTEELEQFYDAVLKNEPGMIPFGFNGAIDAASGFLRKIYGPFTEKHNFSTNVSMVIKPDGTPYVAKTWIPELDPEYRQYLPQELQALDPLWPVKKAHEWYSKGYLEKDVLSQKSAEDQFKAGKAASYFRGIDTYSDIVQQVATTLPDAEIGYFMMDKALRESVPKQMPSTFQAWNFLAIPTNSKYADRVMQFVDWIFAEQSNHDLIQFGIEGQDWIAEGTDKYSLPEGKDLNSIYNFPGYELTWNPQYTRQLSNTPDEVIQIMKNIGDSEFLYKDPAAGFSFNVENVKTEQAKLNDVTTMQRPLLDGMIPEDQMMSNIESIQKKMDAAGAQKVRDEMQKQLEAFLKENPYNGQ